MRPGRFMLGVSIVLVVACGSSGEGESGFERPDGAADANGPSQEVGEPDDGSADDATMEGFVGLIPDEPGAGDLVIVYDYGAAAEAGGLERPEPGADEETINGWFVALEFGREGQPGLGVRPNGFLINEPYNDAAWRQELGWAPIDVTGAVESLGGDDFEGLYAFKGDFDPETIDQAVHDEPMWSDQLEIEEHGGVEYYSWGEDDEPTIENITVVRPYGLGGRMAVLDEHTILWAWATSPLEAGIDAATGETDSLAGNTEIGLPARAMDDEEALAAIFTTDTDAYRQDPPSGEPDDQSTLVRYTALASGTRSADDNAALILAFLHDDADAAEANASRLDAVVDTNTALDGRAWSDIVTLQVAEADDRLLLATLSIIDPNDVGQWIDVVFRRDTLLTSA